MDILNAILADPNISPDLKRVMRPSMTAEFDAFVLRLAAYEEALSKFDWRFEASDDHGFWKRANTELCRLRTERAAIDPQGVVWDTWAPEEYRFSKVLA